MSWNRKWLRLIAALLALAIVLPGDAAIITRAGKGSALTFAEVDENFTELLAGHNTFIAGVIVTKHAGANTLDISAGAFYDPLTGAIITYAGGSGISAGTLGASQHNEVYLSVSGTTATPVVVNNADPPSTAYSGTARKDGSNRRWIGHFLTDGSSNIIDFQALESAHGQLLISPKAATNAAPFRVLSAGAAVTPTLITSAVPGPLYATPEALMSATIQFGSGVGPFSVLCSIDGTVNHDNAAMGTYTDTNFAHAASWVPLIPTSNKFYYMDGIGGTGASPAAYLDALSWKVVR